MRPGPWPAGPATAARGGKGLYAEQGSDGMTSDERGNVYLTRLGVLVFDPDGKQLGAISVPEIPANVRFGGKDGKTLFITARTSLYALRMQVGGGRFRLTRLHPDLAESREVRDRFFEAKGPGHQKEPSKTCSRIFDSAKLNL